MKLFTRRETICVIGRYFLFVFSHLKRRPFSIPSGVYIRRANALRFLAPRRECSFLHLGNAQNGVAFWDRAHETRVCTHISATTRGGLRPVLHRWSSGRVLTSNMRPVQRLYRSPVASTSSARVFLARVCLHSSHPRRRDPFSASCLHRSPTIHREYRKHF